MIDCSKRIYNNAPPCFSDDGNYLVYDNDFSCSIGFVKSESGWRIPKSYLSQKLRENFSGFLKNGDKNFPEDEDFCMYINKLALKIINDFNAQLDGFKRLVYDGHKNHESSGCALLDIVNEAYISYVLSNELEIEKDRLIDAVTDESLEDLDDDSYFRLLIHEVEYPGESEEDWKKREEEHKKLLEWIENHTKKD